MTKFILFDQAGNLVTRYEIGRHSAEQIAAATPVDDELFKRTYTENDGIWKLVDGEVIKLPLPVKTLAELKLEKLNDINAEFRKSMQPIINGIPDIERESWKKQEEEARAYVLNNAAATPMLDGLSTTRGVDKAELVTRIIIKADLFATISGQLIGKRQGLEDQLNALPPTATAEDVEAI